VTDPESRPPSGSPDSLLPFQPYAQLDVGDQLVVYDRRNHQAWVQSDASVRVESMA
jgi:hypothetical protein